MGNSTVGARRTAGAIAAQYGAKCAILILMYEDGEQRLGINGESSPQEIRDALCATIHLTYEEGGLKD